MACMLELPHELYLIICSYLAPHEIANLAGVSRDHYLAAQQPLFFRINLYTYHSFVKLIGTLMKTPIVSHISLKERQHWHKLSDEQLRERDIRHLDILLDCRIESSLITGATFERCIGALVRKCPRVNISIMLYSVWRDFAKQLEAADIPNVKKLSIFLGGGHVDAASINSLETRMWDLAFAGTTFPDLEDVSLSTLVASTDDMPTSMMDGLDLIADRFRPDSAHDPMSSSGDVAYYGLPSMKKIKLEYNTFLNAKVLRSLFCSSIIPNRLMALEIVNCPCLDPVKDLEAVATVFKRGLPLLSTLKVHLAHEYIANNNEEYSTKHATKITEHPEHHLCNIIRVLGQDIKNLDLALPYGCNRIFQTPQKIPKNLVEPLQLPKIPEDPVITLPQRLMAAGYRYRRLIFYGICREAHTWEDMVAIAGSQHGNVSWELLYEPEDKGLWCVSDCLPVEFSMHAAMQCRIR